MASPHLREGYFGRTPGFQRNRLALHPEDDDVPVETSGAEGLRVKCLRARMDHVITRAEWAIAAAF